MKLQRILPKPKHLIGRRVKHPLYGTEALIQDASETTAGVEILVEGQWIRLDKVELVGGTK